MGSKARGSRPDHARSHASKSSSTSIPLMMADAIALPESVCGKRATAGIVGLVRMRRLSVVPLAVLAMLLAAGPALAAEYTVTSTDDTSGQCPAAQLQCTLRQAIADADANPGSTIHVPAGRYLLVAALPALTTSMTIAGAGAATTTVDGGGKARPFTVSGQPVQMRGLTIANGAADVEIPYGGNILVTGGALAATGIRVTRGRAPNGAGLALQG